MRSQKPSPKNPPLSVPNFRPLVTLRKDARQVGTNNSPLVLNSLSASLLGDFLCNTLTVHTTVHNSPRDLSGVLALKEKGLLLGGDEANLKGVRIEIPCWLKIAVVVVAYRKTLESDLM